jgi:hypothetical protein
MSALRQKLPSAGSKLQLPLYSQKQTQLGSRGRSEACHEETHAPQQTEPLFDHFVIKVLWRALINLVPEPANALERQSFELLRNECPYGQRD